MCPWASVLNLRLSPPRGSQTSEWDVAQRPPVDRHVWVQAAKRDSQGEKLKSMKWISAHYFIILGGEKHVSFSQEQLQEVNEHAARLQDTLEHEKAKVSCTALKRCIYNYLIRNYQCNWSELKYDLNTHTNLYR